MWFITSLLFFVLLLGHSNTPANTSSLNKMCTVVPLGIRNSASPAWPGKKPLTGPGQMFFSS